MLNYIKNLQAKRFKVFEEQNAEMGRFDIGFKFGDKVLHAHSYMVFPLSTVLEVMFSERWNEKNQEPLVVETYGYEDFKEFLKFLYLGTCNAKEDNICELIKMSEFYGVEELKSFCDELGCRLSINNDQRINLLECCFIYNLKKLQLHLARHYFTVLHQRVDQLEKCPFTTELATNILVAVQNETTSQKKFQFAFNYSMKKAIDDKNGSGNEDFNIHRAFLSYYRLLVPFFDFADLKREDIFKFAIRNSTIFSLRRKSEMIKCLIPKVYVQVRLATDCKWSIFTTKTPHSLTGSIWRNSSIHAAIQSLPRSTCSTYESDVMVKWNSNCQNMEGTQLEALSCGWHLTLDANGNIVVKTRSSVNSSDIYICHLKETRGQFNDSPFQFSSHTTIELKEICL